VRQVPCLQRYRSLFEKVAQHRCLIGCNSIAGPSSLLSQGSPRPSVRSGGAVWPFWSWNVSPPVGCDLPSHRRAEYLQPEWLAQLARDVGQSGQLLPVRTLRPLRTVQYIDSVNGQQYAFSYSDAGGYSSDVSCSNPKTLVVAIGW
jgi:hypothetical protein